MANGAVDAAAFSSMTMNDKLDHIYYRVVSVEALAKSSSEAARQAADCAEAVKATIDTGIDMHAVACLAARKEEAAAVDKSQTKYMGVIVLLVGLLCTAIGWGLAG